MHAASCAQPKETGSGSTKLARWYYAKSESKCLPFYFTGEGGNRNSYASLTDCEAECPQQAGELGVGLIVFYL